MGSLLDRVLSGSSKRSLDDYHEVDFGDEGIDASNQQAADLQIHVAVVRTNQDLLDVKDALYAGDIVVADVGNPEGSLTPERVQEKLAQVAEDVSGDIAAKGGEELIITPAGVSVSRERIGR